MQEIKTLLNKSGNIIFPAKYRKILGIKPGDEIIMKLDSGEIHIIPSKQTIKNVQKIVRKYISSDDCLSDDLIKDRREEAKHE